jgi:hypothetical protein
MPKISIALIAVSGTGLLAAQVGVVETLVLQTLKDKVR